MSYAEDLFEESLNLVLLNNKFRRGYRSNWLKNEKTGKNLELDFYDPAIKLAFEIQGPRHYNDLSVILRDDTKKRLCSLYDVHLDQCNLNSVHPFFVIRRLTTHCERAKIHLDFRPIAPSWEEHRAKVSAYIKTLKTVHGDSPCTSPFHPKINTRTTKKEALLNFIALHPTFFVRTKEKEAVEVRMLKKISDRKFLVRMLSSPGGTFYIDSRSIVVKDLSPYFQYPPVRF